MRQWPLAAATFAAISAGAASAGAAEVWPERNVSVIVPFAAGGPVDVVARLVGHGLQERFGRPFVIENKAGASGNIGAGDVARSRPDGLTLLLATPAPMGLNKFMGSELRFDPEQDLVPVILVGKSPQIFLAGGGSAASTIPQLLDMARAAPGALNVGTPGLGTTAHIAIEYLQSISKTRITPVHYRASALLTGDLLGGHVEFATNLVPGFAPLVKSGKVKALGVTSAGRSALLPETPTVMEQGFPGFEATAWYVLAAPARTPPDIVASINARANEYLASEDGARQLRDLDVQIAGGTPADARDFISSEMKKWGPLIQAAGIRME